MTKLAEWPIPDSGTPRHFHIPLTWATSPGARINNKKDPVKTKHHTACSSQVTLRAARQAIAGDWTTALSKLGLH